MANTSALSQRPSVRFEFGTLETKDKCWSSRRPRQSSSAPNGEQIRDTHRYINNYVDDRLGWMNGCLVGAKVLRVVPVLGVEQPAMKLVATERQKHQTTKTLEIMMILRVCYGWKMGQFTTLRPDQKATAVLTRIYSIFDRLLSLTQNPSHLQCTFSTQQPIPIAVSHPKQQPRANPRDNAEHH